jgi:ubiquinone/menaquinone biosynthesis C-methylase UbiE
MQQQVFLIEKKLAGLYIWATELLYHPFAWIYEAVAWMVSFGFWSQWRLDTLQYIKSGSVLEIGFGTGALLKTLKIKGVDVTGLEPSKQMQRVAAKRLKKSKLSIKRVRAQAEAIPLKMSHFDNVVSTFPSNYILKPEILQEIYRVLKPSGRLVVSGFGVRFTGGIKRWLTGWLLRSSYHEVLALFLTAFSDAGFVVDVTEYRTNQYMLPVIIAERPDGT